LIYYFKENKMQARALETQSLHEYIIQLKTDKVEMLSYIKPYEFARDVQLKLAEKVAQKLFEYVEPKLAEVLKGE